MNFNPTASAWKTLTVSGNGSGTGAVVGSLASGNLVSNIIGAGLVVSYAGTGGTLNFDNFTIKSTNIGTFTEESVSNGIVTITWPGAQNVCLQSSTNLANWTDIPQSQGQSVAMVQNNSNPQFFRLREFPLGGLQDGSFESGNLGNPGASWQNSGNVPSAASLISGGAYSGLFYLQQSNSAPYQVETYQLVTNLPNGYYKLTAMVKNSGGFDACYISGNGQMTSLPVSSQWTNLIVRGINVTNGQCLVDIYSDDPTGTNACNVDFIQLIKDDLAYSFLKGGDISELEYVEQGGGIFYETNGVQEDCLQILKDHGCNFIRLRLYNDPGNPGWYPSKLLPSGIQNATNILALAARAKAKGFKIELTLTYSDYWADGQTQYKPHGWESLSAASLTNEVYSYTTNIMTEMASQGTVPDYVSLGNQIDVGILLQNSTPSGKPIDTTNAPVNGSYTNFNYLAQLLNAGYAAVKSVSPSTQVIIHSSHVDSDDVTYFFNNCKKYGVNWDVMGCSYYPYWSNLTAEQARDQINSWYADYNKPVLIMETGYNWATNLCDGYAGQLANNGPEPFPSTPLGQKQFMLNCFNALKLVNSGYCLGDLYWDPIFICVPGEGWELAQPNVVDNTTLFNFAGDALPVLDAFYYNN
jgi:arabinogalactan endo-1,4-beta-galactosidase